MSGTECDTEVAAKALALSHFKFSIRLFGKSGLQGPVVGAAGACCWADLPPKPPTRVALLLRDAAVRAHLFTMWGPVAGPGRVYVFITAVPSTKLFASGEGESGGHVLRETTSGGLCGLVCPSRTSEHGIGSHTKPSD